MMRALAIRCVASLLGAAGAGKRLAILTYHRVLADWDPLRPSEPDARRFDGQLAALRASFNVLRMDEAAELLTEGKLPERAVCITFDDGYRDNHDVALPILLRHKLPATFYIATGFLSGGAMFNDLIIEAVRQGEGELDAAVVGERLSLRDLPARRHAISRILATIKTIEPARRAEQAQEIARRLGMGSMHRQMMTSEEIRRIAACGMEIGAHTVRHPILCSLSPEEARTEIADSRRSLETLIGKPVRGFAYPNGRPGVDYGPEHVSMVREAGYSYGVSTRWSSVWPSSSRYELPRIAPWDPGATGFALRVARSYAQR
jgi:peptidoglycan/xylan/chitin deacetylase (PgdA/CDA1 family)